MTLKRPKDLAGAPVVLEHTSMRKSTAYDLGEDLFGPQTDAAPTEDVARHSGRLLREHFRGSGKKGGKRKATSAT